MGVRPAEARVVVFWGLAFWAGKVGEVTDGGECALLGMGSSSTTEPGVSSGQSVLQAQVCYLPLHLVSSFSSLFIYFKEIK